MVKEWAYVWDYLDQIFIALLAPPLISRFFCYAAGGVYGNHVACPMANLFNGVGDC